MDHGGNRIITTVAKEKRKTFATKKSKDFDSTGGGNHLFGKGRNPSIANIQNNCSLYALTDPVLYRYGIIVTSTSCLLCLILCSVAFYLYFTVSSSVALAIGCETLVDALTSTIVLWRLSTCCGPDPVIKERISVISLGVILILSGLWTLGKSSYSLYYRDCSHAPDALVFFSVVAASILFVVSIVKFIVATKINSKSMMLDGIDSVIGGILSLSVVLTRIIRDFDGRIWFFDCSVGVLAAIVMLIYGSVFLYKYAPKRVYKPEPLLANSY